MNNLHGKNYPEEADFRKGQHGKDFTAAVSIVRDELSEDSAKVLRYSLEHKAQRWGPSPETSLGIALRNLLATKGIFWEDVAMHPVWIAIFRKAVETMLDS